MARLPFVPRELHTTARPSRTAQWTTLIRALELRRDEDDRIVSDRFAPLFLSGLNQRALGPLIGAGPLLGVAERRAAAGITTSVLCRHRFIDGELLESLPEVSQVLVLGAGYDSRAYRFAHAIGRRPVYEIDLAPISRRKARIAAAAPDRFGSTSVHRLEIDFRTQSLTGRIAASSFRLGAPTFVAWEGVSMYLSRADVTRTLDSLATVCGPGSVIAMDFWRPTPGRAVVDRLRRAAVHGMAMIGEPITFTVEPDEASDLLAASNFGLVDLADGATMTTRYVTGRRHCDDGMFVAAGRLR